MRTYDRIETARWVAKLRRNVATSYDDEDEMADTVELDPGRYTDKVRFEREKQKFFFERPQFIALSGDLPEPGTFFTTDIAGRPILLTRDRGGQAHAFLNACRHRGVPVAGGCGKAGGFTCPYHGWTYGIDGSLKSVPSRDAFEPEQLAGRGLVRLPLHEELGCILVHADPEGSIDFDGFFGPMKPLIADSHFEQYIRIDAHTSREEANWKHMLEGGVEAYHVAVLHKDSYKSPDGKYGHLRLGEHETLLTGTDQARALADAPADQWPQDELLCYVTSAIFPNTAIGGGGRPIIWFQRSEPGEAPGIANYSLRIFGKRGSSPEQQELEREGGQLYFRAFLSEDVIVQKRAQKAMENGAVLSLLYGRRELCPSRLQRYFDKVLAED